MMNPSQILFFLYFFGLPGALWFALDARMAKLNPWVWALWGMLALFVPTVLIISLVQLLAEHGLSVSNLEPPWSRAAQIVGTIVLMVLLVLPVVTIHKRVLKPRRLEAIGASLNYVGGWLGTFIYMLFGSAVASLFLYVSESKKEIEYFCRDEKTWQSVFQCLVSFMPETLGTPLTIIFVIVSVAGAICAALALSCKKSYAVPITGCLAMGLLLLNLVYYWQGMAQASPGLDYSHSPAAGVQTRAILVNLLLLVYLTSSRRVREVYGRHFWEPNRSSVGGQPEKLT